MDIIDMRPEHWPQVARIYEEGIATGNATFQTSAPSWSEWDGAHLQHSRCVAVEGDEVLGWAALTPVSGRCVYAGVAEISVYVAEKARGRGLGSALLDQLIASSESHGIWTLQAGVFPENTASLKLHETCGFRTIGIREKIGKMGDRWRDTVLLERRSQVTGN